MAAYSRGQGAGHEAPGPRRCLLRWGRRLGDGPPGGGRLATAGDVRSCCGVIFWAKKNCHEPADDWNMIVPNKVAVATRSACPMGRSASCEDSEGSEGGIQLPWRPTRQIQGGGACLAGPLPEGGGQWMAPWMRNSFLTGILRRPTYADRAGRADPFPSQPP